MTIVGTHRGAVSGKVHVHLLRESAAERAARAAATRQGDGARAGSDAADPSFRDGQSSAARVNSQRRFG
jgi:hypothetical protein